MDEEEAGKTGQRKKRREGKERKSLWKVGKDKEIDKEEKKMLLKNKKREAIKTYQCIHFFPLLFFLSASNT